MLIHRAKRTTTRIVTNHPVLKSRVVGQDSMSDSIESILVEDDSDIGEVPPRSSSPMLIDSEPEVEVITRKQLY